MGTGSGLLERRPLMRIAAHRVVLPVRPHPGPVAGAVSGLRLETSNMVSTRSASTPSSSYRHRLLLG